MRRKLIPLLMPLKSLYFQQFSTDGGIKPVGSDKSVILRKVTAFSLGWASWVSWRSKNEIVKSELVITMCYFCGFFILTDCKLKLEGGRSHWSEARRRTLTEKEAPKAEVAIFSVPWGAYLTKPRRLLTLRALSPTDYDSSQCLVWG
jgi:hypothetical protein